MPVLLVPIFEVMAESVMVMSLCDSEKAPPNCIVNHVIGSMTR